MEGKWVTMAPGRRNREVEATAGIIGQPEGYGGLFPPGGKDGVSENTMNIW